jgi:CheY-like chemotaxis protein
VKRAVPTQQRRILLIEDNLQSRVLYSTILRHHGYHVSIVDRIDVAVAIAIEQRPDMILSDLTLPTGDAWSGIQAIRENPSTRDIPLVVVSARDTDEDIERCRALGCAEYLVKPVARRTILEVVDRFAGSGARNQASVPESSGLGARLQRLARRFRRD